MVTLPDTCNEAVTVAARLCQILFVPVSCEHTEHIMPIIVAQWMCSTSPFALVGYWAVYVLIGSYLPWSAVRPRNIRSFHGGYPGACALRSEQNICGLFGHKLLVDEYSANGLVGHSSRVTARQNTLLWSEQLYRMCATSDSLLATCRGLFGFINS